MRIFSDEETGKFRGGILLYAFDDLNRTKVTVTAEMPREPGAYQPKYRPNMEIVMSAKILEKGNVEVVPVTLSEEHLTNVLFLEATGEIRTSFHNKFSVEERNAVQYLVDCILENIGEVPTEEEKAEARARKIGVHVSHCCVMHGCKYGDGEDCAVENKTHRQDYPCESCVDVEEAEEQIKYLQEQIAFRKSFKS